MEYRSRVPDSPHVRGSRAPDAVECIADSWRNRPRGAIPVNDRPKAHRPDVTGRGTPYATEIGEAGRTVAPSRPLHRRGRPRVGNVAVTQLDPSSPGGQYLLTVTVPPGMPPGDIDDQIVLKTDHPKAGEVKIPVAIRIQGE